MAAALPAVPAAARAPDRRCYPHDAYGYAASTRVRLYEVSAPDDFDHRTLFVCDLVTGRRTKVDDALDTEESFEPSDVRFAGRIVAFRLEHCLKAECDRDFVALDSRTGRRLPAGPRAQLLGWVLGPGGSLAWVEAGQPLRLESFDGASTVVQDEGTGIDSRSLAFSDASTLYWMHDGGAHRARVGVPSPPVAAVDPRGSARCYPAGSRTLVASTTRVRVYRRSRGTTETVVACALRSGRRTGLVSGHSDDAPGFDVLRVRGPFVAFAAHSCVKADCVHGGPQVVDARTGKQLHENALTRDQPVEALVLAENGSIAWIAGEVTKTVARCDLRGCAAIATETGLVADLALSDASFLYWSNGTEPRVADLR